ncbi:carbon storage regulator [Alkalicoccus chagannorensis]|uniref:carbon storage regulator n=1 Tax=Alkalicoccus chagannorensis TaxID=427072 RepID=UPI00041A6E69|nr:carbon storage regulator [Alkalicoccus chagannorensis]
MLVVGREPGEYIVIGDDIKVRVVKNKKGQLRLAVEAPDHVSIVRGEVYEEQQEREIVVPDMRAKAATALRQIKENEPSEPIA